MKTIIFLLSTIGILFGCHTTSTTTTEMVYADSVKVIQTIFQDSILINKVKVASVPPTLVFSKIIRKKWPLKILNKDINYNANFVDSIENKIMKASDLPLNLLAVTGFTQLKKDELKVTVRLVGGGWVLQYILKKDESSQWKVVSCIKSYI
ncbi:hypothetical protein [Runella sp. SP2]|uniref:hypothetical protein n=1 Tax=Runella sp. SP2 TaxID=2268026 RepID=UPI0013DD8F31|nr:hypothetical protein [Runella sp. SP2]